jgi:pilus assembly protein CpaB
VATIEPASPSAANRPNAARPVAEEPPAERRRGMDRRQSDRRGMDKLRTEALQNVISMVEDRNFGGLRRRLQVNRSGPGIPKSRLLLLGLALAAGGLAAWLAMQQPSAPVPVVAPEVVEAPMAQVLVAHDAIEIGQRLTPAMLEWVGWPETAVHADFITDAAAPDAMTDIAGSVARYPFFPGEPIQKAKLADGSAGFLAAMLEPGTRAVSVEVQAASASGGFIVPNDRVDVVLARPMNGTQESQTILSNVKVLAINGRLGDSPADADAEAEVDNPSTQAFANQAIAILALDPAAARVIINATGMGSLSLTLRPASEAAAPPAGTDPVNAAIRMTSPFWTSAQTGSTPR